VRVSFLKLPAVAGLASAIMMASTTLRAADDAALSRADAQKLKSPIPYTKKSVDQGRVTLLSNCTGCHGADGKAEASIIAEATDLTSPKLYKNGTSEGELFRSIRDGAGDQMPPFKYQMTKDEEMWRLVNFVRSLWPERCARRS
jgi:mono/diheme cytochrome c family protein